MARLKREVAIREQHLLAAGQAATAAEYAKLEASKQQVAIAEALKVSRTPVREAMRMLQEGGLLTGEPNYRSRVVEFDPVDIEALYAKRLKHDALVDGFFRRDRVGDLQDFQPVCRNCSGSHSLLLLVRRRVFFRVVELFVKILIEIFVDLNVVKILSRELRAIHTKTSHDISMHL